MVCDTRIGARPTEGSSTSSSLGADISARAMASICCCPPDIEPASWRRALGEHRERLVAELRGSSRSRRARSGRNAPSSRFSSTVSFGNRRRPSGTMATPRLTICSVERLREVVRLAVELERSRTPRVGRTMPMTHFISVLLPLPLVPSSATVCALRQC